MRLIDAEPIEQTLFKQADKSMAKNPYENARICAFRRALELILDAPAIAPPPNDPLTLEELRGMDGEPVWIDDWFEDFHGWELSETASDYFEGDSRTVEAYGTRWLAYRRKPEEGTT